MIARNVTLGVDGNWVLHRAFHTQGKRENPGEAIKRVFVSMVCKDALMMRATSMLIAFDGDEIFRYKVYSGYKGNREASADGTSPYDYLKELKKYLKRLGLPCVQRIDVEADDLMCSLAAQTKTPVAVSTKDKDSYQFVRPHIRLIDSSAKPLPVVTSYKMIEARFGVRPELCVDLQTLTGDKIDNIPDLMTRAKAIKGLKQWGSIKEWAAGDKEFRKFAKANTKALNRNRKLVRLLPDLELPSTKIVWSDDSKNVPDSYIALREFANPKSKGLF